MPELCETHQFIEEPAHDDCDPFGNEIENSTDCILHLTPPNGGFTFAPDSSDEEEPEEQLPEPPIEVIDADDPSIIQEPEAVGTLSDLDDSENIVGDEFVGLEGNLDEDTVLSTEPVASSAGFSSMLGLKRPRDEDEDAVWSQNLDLKS